MVQFDVEIRPEQMQQVQALLAAIPKGWQKAASRALNKTGAAMRTRVIRAIQHETGLQQKRVRERFRMTKASYSNLSVKISIWYRIIPMLAWGARQNKSGVVWGREKTLIPHAFIATMPSGHKGVFKRIAAPRLPIRELMGGRLTDILRARPGLMRTQEKVASDILAVNLRTQVKLLLDKARGRAAA